MIAQHLLPNPPQSMGVAVSGGSDSLGLLFLLHEFTQNFCTKLHVVTIDHGLRAEAAQEATYVAQICDGLELPHKTLTWSDWQQRGNLQNEARLARYRLISAWARERDIEVVALGHTLDDQAETVLMRLARGAGVDGLTAMTSRRTSDGVTWVRPMLEISRSALQDYLRRRNVSWCSDPSNEDTRYDRVKMRHALAVLEPLGITAKALGQVATNMARARDALGWQAFLAARSMVAFDCGAVRVDWRSYITLPDEIARRILVNAIGWISGAPYAPRRKAVQGLIDAMKQGVNATADGCQVSRRGDILWIYREYAPVRALRADVGALWDGRWRLLGNLAGTTHIAALGAEGLPQVSDWRSLGVPRDVLLSTPAVWNGPELVAAPLAGFDRGWRAQLEIGEEALFAALLSH